ETLHLRVVLLGVRRQGGRRSRRRFAARAAHRLLALQGHVRGGAGGGTGARVRDAHAQAGDGLRLLAAPALGRDRQYPDHAGREPALTMNPPTAATSRSDPKRDDVLSLARVSARLRGEVILMSHRARTPHLGSSLSCIDILTAAYWSVLNIDPKAPTAT